MFIWRHITTRPVDSLHRRIWNLHDRKENLSGHCGTDRERQFIIRNLVRALWGTEREAIHNQESCPGTVGQTERGSSQSGILSGHCRTERERQFTIRSLVRALWDRQREAVHNQESCPGTVGQTEREAVHNQESCPGTVGQRERQFTIRSLVRALWDRQREAVHNQESCPGTVGQTEMQYTIRNLVRV